MKKNIQLINHSVTLKSTTSFNDTMLIYSNTIHNFQFDVVNGVIVARVVEEFKKRLYNIENQTSQINALNNSLQFMNTVLSTEQIPKNLHIAIEFQIPLTSKRVDFMISGVDNDDQKNIVIIELKQWSDATPLNNPTTIKTFVGQGYRRTVHPSYQAYTYAKTIDEFNESIRNNDINLLPCAFLHNFPNSKRNILDNQVYKEYVELAPLFLQQDILKLRNFISQYVRKTDHGESLHEIDNGKIKPSKSLQDVISNMLHGNEEFLLIDEQEIAYQTILEYINESNMLDNKTVIIIEGGPGTGKTVIAINLLVKLLNKKLNTAYVTKNAAPRNIFSARLIQGDHRRGYINNLFKSSGSFVKSKYNDYDCLIVDEAHRLNLKSGFRNHLGENQIKEIINASKVSVFFIDENQRVTAKDVGTIDEIKKWAKKLGANLVYNEDTKLVSQFRCNGSDGYLAFLDHLLGIKETAHFDLSDLDYDFQVFDSPTKLMNVLRVKNEENNKSRMVAGYTYNWISDKNPELYDIELEDNFKAQWNLRNDSTYAISEDSFEQIGCIHTVQGIEFEYVGVIIGLDLRYEDGKIITDHTKRATTDFSLHGSGKFDDPNAARDEIIRNTYKTLMSRGLKGCYVYCEDKNLSEYLKKIIK